MNSPPSWPPLNSNPQNLMSQITNIQWADSTVNPTMGCSGCELFPTPAQIILRINRAVEEQLSSSAKSELAHEINNDNQTSIESKKCLAKT